MHVFFLKLHINALFFTKFHCPETERAKTSVSFTDILVSAQ